MEAWSAVALLWGLFGGIHIGLTTRSVRAALASRLGEWGFRAAFSLASVGAFAWLVSYFAAHRIEGPPGLALGEAAWLRWLLIGVMAVGSGLVAAGLAGYSGSPMALFGQEIRPPRGIERITRHPFFAGVALVALAHVPLATRLVGAVFAAGFAVVCIAGAYHQDAKLLLRKGRPYADYLAASSGLPFAAVVSGRQRIVWGELRLGAFAAGLAVALVLGVVPHDSMLAHGGAWVIAAVVATGAIATFQDWRRARRSKSAVPSAPAQQS